MLHIFRLAGKVNPTTGLGGAFVDLVGWTVFGN